MNCAICTEPLDDLELDGYRLINNGDRQTVHAACLIRMTMGSVEHQSRQCSCFRGATLTGPDVCASATAMATTETYRQSALRAWRYFVEYNVKEEQAPSWPL
jgi:hypothetical protein